MLNLQIKNTTYLQNKTRILMCLQYKHKATQKINLYTLQQNLVLVKFLITDKEMAVQNGLDI